MSKKRAKTTAIEPAIGRPIGVKNAERACVSSKPPACPKCQSTRREPYRDGPIKTMIASGAIDGQRYNRIVWRDTKCMDCGQFMRVKEFLFEPEESPILEAKTG